MQNNRPLLSIGMIVKNEMRCLKRCLEALAPLREALPCQLVIADTGSTDGTRELAAEYADIIFDFEWCNDFSAARNAVLDRCTGEWHMQVDADEYLDGDFRQLIAFLKSKEAKQRNLAYITQRNYNTIEMLEGDYSDFLAPRMLRIPSGIKYVGTIHEVPSTEGQRIPAVKLDGVVLHHDGYTGSAGVDNKKKRNMLLLEREMEKEPDSLRRMLQCLESSYTREQRYKYAELATAAAGRSDCSPDDKYYRMAIFQAAATRTMEDDFPEYSQWVARGKELFPDSILIRVGVSCAYALYLSRKKEHEECYKALETYFAGLEDYRAGRYDIQETQSTMLAGIEASTVSKMRLLQIYCHRKLGQWDRLVPALEATELDCAYNEALHTNYLSGVMALWRAEIPGAKALLKRAVDTISAREDKDTYNEFFKLCMLSFANAGSEHMQEGQQEWRIFATLGDGCDLGRFGLIMAAEDAARASELLAKVERLDLLPPAALQHALSLGAALPEGFFRQNAEQLSAHAAGLAKLLKDKPNTAAALCGNAGGDPGKALFGYILATELAGNLDWEKQGGMALMDYYCDRAEEYLDTFYNPAMLAAERLYALPMLARFAAHCAQARKARRAGDELGYVRELKAGLETCPGMKNMVAWLVERAKAKAAGPKATPELMALAEQIRAILAQYPADDPAVLALKASGEYKLVAHLIEEEQ